MFFNIKRRFSQKVYICRLIRSFVANLIRIHKMYKLLYKNPDCGLNITWRQLDHENRSELTYDKKNFFKNNISIDIFRFKYCF